MKYIIFGSFLGLVGFVSGAQDAEERLNEHHSARSTYNAALNKNLGNPNVQRRSTLKAQGLTEEEFEERRRWFVAKYPGTDIAAKAEADRVKEYFDAGQWEAAIGAAEDVLEKYPEFGVIRARVLYLLIRIVNNKEIPNALREASLALVWQNAQNAAGLIAMTGNYISQNASWSPAEKLDLALKAEVSAGSSPRMRDFVWRFLSEFAKESPDEGRQIITSFLERYPDESLAAWEARQRLSETEGHDADKREPLKQFREERRAVEAQVKRLCAQAEAEAQAGEFERVAETFEELAALPHWATDIPWWGRFVSTYSEELPISLVQRAMEIVPPGASGDELLSGIVRNEAFRYHAEGARIVMEATKKYAYDILRHGTVLRSRLIRMQVPLEDLELRVWAYGQAADIAKRLGMKDAASEFLFESAKFLVLDEPDTARSMLSEASQLSPGSEAGVNARWLLALMNGPEFPFSSSTEDAQEALSVVAPLQPRGFVAGDVSEPPVVELPKIPTGGPQDVVTENGSYALRAQDTEVDVADWAKRTGTARQTENGWQPGNLPASLIVPLKTPGTLKNVRLQFSAPSKFTVTLLDREGRKLCRVARDWPFWDPYDLQVPWPGPEEILDLPPVADVQFIRVDLFESQTDKPTLKSVEAEATPVIARGQAEMAPASVPPRTKSLSINWTAQLPENETVYDIQSESVQPYPIVRWFRPWTKKTMRNNLGIGFFGDDAVLSISGSPGFVKWALNGKGVDEIRQEAPVDRKAATEVSMEDLSNGRQYLRLTKGWVAGRAVMTFDKLTVKGRARAGVKVRFDEGTGWGSWQGPFWQSEGESIAVPDSARKYQVAIDLDAGPVRAEVTPELSNLTIQPSATVVGGWKSPTEKEALPEKLEPVVESLAKRLVAVVYSKVGTTAEYDLAQQLARKAGVPLISDDVVLNLNSAYYGPLLAVGTPRDNRLARQLIGMCGVWNDRSFLNNPDGVVSQVDDIDGNTYLFVTGDTPAAVEKAGQRLLAAMAQAVLPSDPFYVFDSNTLTVPYPWQPGFDRPELNKVLLRLGVNDRRSQQFALTTNRELANLNVEVSELNGVDGTRLPAPRIRALGGYEWMQFFGDLRLPNFLLDKPKLPVPGLITLGFWISVQTSPDTAPGRYEGTIRIGSEAFSKEIPLIVQVEPVKLPDFAGIDTYSYASVPWWYLPGTKTFDDAVRALAENEREKRVNTLAPRMMVEWEVANNLQPSQFATAPPGTAIRSLKWKKFNREPKVVPAGEALYLKFPETLRSTELGGGFRSPTESELIITIPGQAPIGRQSPLGGKEWSAFRFPTPGHESDVFEIKSADGKEFEAGLVRAFLEAPIVRYDFAETLRQMGIIEDVYREQGLAMPAFRLHMTPILGREVSQNLFGVGHWHFGGGAFATDFVRQLKEQLKEGGRDQRTFLKVGDEPRTLADWAKVAKPFKEGGLNVMTAHYSGRPDVAEAVGIMNPWCPNYEHDLDDPVIRERQKAGDKMWWYQCGVPATRLTGKPVDNLPIYWLTAKWNLDGVANYAALGAKESGPEGSPIPFRYDHGMGYRINFLPDGTLLDTPRRELEAEGIKDYALIENIREGIEALRQDGKPVEAGKAQENLDAIIESVVPGKRGYPTDAAPWLAARNGLYDLAVQVRSLLNKQGNL